mgnify:CR=1 FL=1
MISNGDKIYATVEAGGAPVEINRELESLPTTPFDGTLNSAFSAHTKLDAQTGELHAMCYEFPRGSYQVHHVIVGKNGTIITYPDGITWTTRTSGTSNPLYGVIFGE